MGYENWKSYKEEDEDLYNRDSFTSALRYEGFSPREAEDIVNDWKDQKDK